MTTSPTNPEHDTNSDPLTGETGAHPVATGLGAATVGSLGIAAAAAVAGPVGLAVALVGGAVIGGYVGKAAGEVVDPTDSVEQLNAEVDTSAAKDRPAQI